MCRIAVTAHEYYHVLQIHYCPTYDDRTHFVMWLSEGAATVLQNLYVTYWISNHWSYRDSLFDPDYGHVRQMMDKVQSGEYVYSSALNSHEGRQTTTSPARRRCSTSCTAKAGAATCDTCSLTFCSAATATSQPMVAWMPASKMPLAFGRRSTRSTQTSTCFSNGPTPPTRHQPSNCCRAQSVADPFNHTTMCSDVCELSRNGVCDSVRQRLHGLRPGGNTNRVANRARSSGGPGTTI